MMYQKWLAEQKRLGKRCLTCGDKVTKEQRKSGILIGRGRKTTVICVWCCLATLRGNEVS